jgi:ribosomal protein L27
MEPPPDVIRRVLGRQLYATEVVYGKDKVVFAASDGKSKLKFTITVEQDIRVNPETTDITT